MILVGQVANLSPSPRPFPWHSFPKLWRWRGGVAPTSYHCRRLGNFCRRLGNLRYGAARRWRGGVAPTSGHHRRPGNLRYGGRKRGAAFVLAVFALAILVSLATAFASLSRADIRLTTNFGQRLQCLALCRSGVDLAMAELAADLDATGESEEEDATRTDSLLDRWAELGGASGERIDLETGWIRLEITDASARLNVNEAPRDALRALLPDMTDDVADGLIDWRDEDEEPLESGAEADYYLSLGEGYLPADAPFLSLEECRLVKGVTDDLFFGLLEGDSLTPGLVDVLTTHSGEEDVTSAGEPRLDVNTADQQELRRRLGESVERQALEALIDLRARGGLRSLGQLLEVSGWTPQAVAATVDELTVSHPPQGGQGPGAANAAADEAEPQADAAEAGGPRLREGTVNVNTAPEEVLAALPEMTDELLQAILDRREDEPFASIGELLDLDESALALFRQSADLLATKSAYFLVRVAAGLDDDGPAQVVAEAVLRRTGDGLGIVHWRETDSRVLRKVWKWEL